MLELLCITLPHAYVIMRYSEITIRAHMSQAVRAAAETGNARALDSQFRAIRKVWNRQRSGDGKLTSEGIVLLRRAAVGGGCSTPICSGLACPATFAA